MISQINKVEDPTEILPPGEFPPVLLIYVYALPYSPKHEGLLKIGQTTLKLKNEFDAKDFPPNCKELNEAADKRIQQDLGAAGVPYNLLHTELAVDMDGKSFGDKRVHKVLENSGHKHVPLIFKKKKAVEWFKIDLPLAKMAIVAVKNKRTTISYEPLPSENPATYETAQNESDLSPDEPSLEQIEFRKEQKRAIKKTVKYFQNELKKSTQNKVQTRRDREFLWNAKMRFGKTLCALEVIRRINEDEETPPFWRTIIVTHRPVVRGSWGKEFNNVFPRGASSKQYDFSFNEKESFSNYARTKNSLIYFASIQYLRHLKKARSQREIEEKEAILGTDWDLVIVDEAHEGTATPLGSFVLENLKKEKTCVLHLSGTPFNMADDFDESNSFTWDYLMEQEYKQKWLDEHPDEMEENSPYYDLPDMSILAYSLEGKLKERYMDVADKCFSFTEFFKIADDGETFVHEDDVRRFLDLLRTAENYPFTDKYWNFFCHTFWVVPGVKQGKALEKLLNEHKDFGNNGKGKFKIVNICGDGIPFVDDDDENKAVTEVRDALQKVEIAIRGDAHNKKPPEKPRTITLSCGKLTLGVSVPEWTAVFYLAGSYKTSMANYMQTIFRAQTPVYKGKKDEEGRPIVLKDEEGHTLVKKRCYAFDFAPDRTLAIFNSLSDGPVGGNAPPKDEAQKREAVRKLLEGFNVIAVKDSKMKRIEEESFFKAINRACVTEIVKKGFESSKLFDDEQLKKFDPDILEVLKAKIGSRKRVPLQVVVSQGGFTDDGTSDNDQGANKKKRQQTHTQEEQAAQAANRRNALSVLLNATVRIPLLVFGAGAGKEGDVPERDFTKKKFSDNFDDESWREFMGRLSKKQFEEWVVPCLKKGVFSQACQRIRDRVKDADSLPPLERMEKIVGIHSEFKNPDKETVLTPWRVVNRHLGDTLGGYSFFDDAYEQDYLREAEESSDDAKTLFRTTKATAKTLANPNAKILEINSKTGLYPLYVAYSLMREKLQRKENESLADAEKRTWKDVVENNLFIICRTEMAAAITRRTLLGFDSETKLNIHYEEDFVEKAAELVSEKNDKNLFDRKEDAAGLRAERRKKRMERLEKFLGEIREWKWENETE